MTQSSVSNGVLLIKGGRVFELAGDVDAPPIADILIIDGEIAAVGTGLDGKIRASALPEIGGRKVDEVIEASDKLVIPGFVNAHYHSHDVLLKGCFETIPLELWLMSALPPNYPKRSAAEIRARTLVGAIECLRGGITTVQDLATLYPFDEEHLDTVLQAYEDVGIRCVFALQIADIPGVKLVPFWDEVVPERERALLTGATEPLKGIDLPTLTRDIVRSRQGRHQRVTWALGPSSPGSCSEDLLTKLSDLSRSDDLPIYTHIYESKAMTLSARHHHARDGGSLVNYLKRLGLLSPRLTLAHSIWMAPAEMEALASEGVNVVLNPVSNLKTRGGVAPIPAFMSNRVNLGLGCDNCSCSDAQNMFQAMKMFTSLAGLYDQRPGPPTAADAIHAATIGGARTAGLQGRIGAIRPGMAADLSILDLSDPAFVPLNSAARQLVFSECGRSVETVIVDGRVVVRNRKIMTIDERSLREEVAELMKTLREDLRAVMARNQRLLPYLMDAHQRICSADVGINRYISG
jgi:5-methylthioadenosine/S-adenosylhomocysteine deaminase